MNNNKKEQNIHTYIRTDIYKKNEDSLSGANAWSRAPFAPNEKCRLVVWHEHSSEGTHAVARIVLGVNGFASMLHSVPQTIAANGATGLSEELKSGCILHWKKFELGGWWPTAAASGCRPVRPFLPTSPKWQIGTHFDTFFCSVFARQIRLPGYTSRQFGFRGVREDSVHPRDIFRLNEMKQCRPINKLYIKCTSL